MNKNNKLWQKEVVKTVSLLVDQRTLLQKLDILQLKDIMAVEGNLSKVYYKIELFLLKIIPFILATVCFINTTLSYFNIDITFLSYLGGVSILPLIFLYLSSYVFKFCFYHRLPLYYITINLILNLIDEYIGIPLNNRQLYSIYVIITFIFITFLIYEHCKKNSIKIIKRNS